MIALILVIAALAAVAILGTLLLTRDSGFQGVAGGEGPHHDRELRRRGAERRSGHAAQHHLRHHPRQLRELRREGLGRHPRQGRRGQAVPGGGQHRPDRRQRRPRRGQRDDVHGLCAADQVDPQLRPAVPRRPVEDLPGALRPMRSAPPVTAPCPRCAGRCTPRRPAPTWRPRPSSCTCAGRRPSCCRPRRRSSARRRSWRTCGRRPDG